MEVRVQIDYVEHSGYYPVTREYRVDISVIDGLARSYVLVTRSISIFTFLSRVTDGNRILCVMGACYHMSIILDLGQTLIQKSLHQK